jgi:hypothetical protein
MFIMVIVNTTIATIHRHVQQQAQSQAEFRFRFRFLLQQQAPVRHAHYNVSGSVVNQGINHGLHA